MVEVFLLSRNTADTGLRIFNSIQYHGLDIEKAAFCGGNSPHIYAKSFGVHLFLSTEFEDCKSSINSGNDKYSSSLGLTSLRKKIANLDKDFKTGKAEFWTELRKIIVNFGYIFL